VRQFLVGRWLRGHRASSTGQAGGGSAIHL
jgi:hypothetical protein